jgi:hypothetical protein
VIHHLDDMHFEGPNLDLPSPPPDLPYERYEDWRSTTLLAINGIHADEASLLTALDTQANVLLSAAAHTAGSTGARAAIPRLREVAKGEDDYAAAEAAYALARLGDEDGARMLRAAATQPAGALLGPVLAAGYLAQLGDPAGFEVVATALESSLLATRMLACKQLYFFAPFDAVDARALLERALSDPEETVRRQARAELDELGRRSTT